MQEPEDDVTGVAAIELAGLFISFLLDKAGLICGAALWGRVKSKSEGVITKNGHRLHFMICCYQSLWPVFMDP